MLGEEEVWEFVAEKDEHVANELLNSLDTNDDGEIDFSEFLVVWKLLYPPKEPGEADVVEEDFAPVAVRKAAVPPPTVSAPVSEPSEKKPAAARPSAAEAALARAAAARKYSSLSLLVHVGFISGCLWSQARKPSRTSPRGST